MADSARVDSIDVIRSFRAALWKFAETANAALGDAESDVNKTLVWLENEQQTHWQHQVRLRMEAVAAAKDKVRQKQLFKDSTGRQQSAVDEQKLLAIAQRKLQEAEQKLAATKTWSRRMQRETHNYKGGVQRLQTMVSVDLPNAVATLDRMYAALEKYVAAGPASVTSTAAPAPAGAPPAAGEGGASMTWAVTEAAPAKPEPEKAEGEAGAAASETTEPAAGQAADVATPAGPPELPGPPG